MEDFYEKYLMPCPFTCPKMFWVGQNVLCQIKDLVTFCARQKDNLHSVKLVFVVARLIAVKLFGWLKKFGAAQNILGPVKGQGIS